jgi:hypothetical protein
MSFMKLGQLKRIIRNNKRFTVDKFNFIRNDLKLDTIALIFTTISILQIQIQLLYTNRKVDGVSRDLEKLKKLKND